MLTVFDSRHSRQNYRIAIEIYVIGTEPELLIHLEVLR
jgi:hypothetical protein